MKELAQQTPEKQMTLHNKQAVPQFYRTTAFLNNVNQGRPAKHRCSAGAVRKAQRCSTATT
jgi:hypothetical protein